VDKDNQHVGLGAATGPEEMAIQGTIDRFACGIRQLDGGLVSSAFHSEGSSFSVTARGICIEPAKAWAEIMRQARNDDAHLFRERFSVQTLHIDVAGTAATAKVEWEFQSTRVVDFYNLLKTGDGWLITGQVYHTFSRAMKS
jgi:hypothetical protein